MADSALTAVEAVLGVEVVGAQVVRRTARNASKRERGR
jgi:hypothetical protein